MGDIEQIQSDILGETPDRQTVEVAGHELQMSEMTVKQYGRFANVSELDTASKLQTIYEICFENLRTPDGQQVFGDEHLDSFLETSADDGAPAKKLREAFLQVNGLAPTDAPPAGSASEGEGN